jgi:hypothetical protein
MVVAEENLYSKSRLKCRGNGVLQSSILQCFEINRVIMKEDYLARKNRYINDSTVTDYNCRFRLT